MKLAKFLALSIAALSMVACGPVEDNEDPDNGGGFITQEYVKVYSDVSAAGWETVGVWAWSLEDQSNYTGGTWPGQQLTEVEVVDGKTYHVWNAPKEIIGQTIGFIVNDFGAAGKQTVDLNVTIKEEGNYVVLVKETSDGKWLASVDGSEVEEPEEKPVPEMKLEEHTWGVIGSFNDWSTDVAMTITDGWAVATFDLTEGKNEFKVRADSDWTDSYGVNGDVTVYTDGTEFDAIYNGSNIVVEPGNYTLSFAVNGQVGTFKLVKNN